DQHHRDDGEHAADQICGHFRWGPGTGPPCPPCSPRSGPGVNPGPPRVVRAHARRARVPRVVGGHARRARVPRVVRGHARGQLRERQSRERGSTPRAAKPRARIQAPASVPRQIRRLRERQSRERVEASAGPGRREGSRCEEARRSPSEAYSEYAAARGRRADEADGPFSATGAYLSSQTPQKRGRSTLSLKPLTVLRMARSPNRSPYRATGTFS